RPPGPRRADPPRQPGHGRCRRRHRKADRRAGACVKGRCACGGVTITVPGRPEYLNSCDCSLCFRLGGLWGYYDPAEVTVEGETRPFQRTDIEVWLDTNFCPTCSAVVSWTAVRDIGTPKMGVNMRLF